VKVKKSESGNYNMYDIVGMVGDKYIVKTVGWIKPCGVELLYYSTGLNPPITLIKVLRE
jgi:hypothetical protein